METSAWVQKTLENLNRHPTHIATTKSLGDSLASRRSLPCVCKETIYSLLEYSVITSSEAAALQGGTHSPEELA